VIRIGDAARLAVTVDHPAGGSVELPALDQGRAVVVTDRKRESAALEGGRERTTFVVLLTSFDVGEHRIGGGEIRFAGQSGAVLPATPFPETTLRVGSVLVGEDTPMRGAKDLVRWPAPIARWAGLAAAFLLLAVAAILGARRVRTGRRRAPAAVAPVVLPHETALRALAALRAALPIPHDQVEPSYRELSSIVRRYLEERFGLKAPERATEELIREAAGSGLLAPAHQELVRDFLEQCDLVKFARHLPPHDDLTTAIAAAERLVRETRPPGAPASSGKRVAGR
jgi:hypothetical protein